ncbi:ABC transporter substrate-binding protein [Aeromicrobium sp. CTD01-1L150]|uniref:ABC transporter substrate-binding protein n=1 Tax=Aeromicrobium sp. CTD01-1L150 TaxID=3341830 RepID=UPI0035BEE82A
MRQLTRKVPLASVAVLAVTTLTACGAAEDGGSGGDGEGRTIAFVQGVAGDEFYISMRCGVEEAAEAAGADVDVQGPEKFDPSLQKPIVDSVVSSQPDALLVAPTDVSAMQAPLEAAADAGIEVVLVDTTVEDPSFAASAIASDNVGGGEAAFEAIKELNPDGGKVLVIGTDPGVSTLDARVEGFEQAAGGDSDFEYVGVQYSRNEPARAAQLVTAALQKDPDIVGIFAANLFAAEGTGTGVRQADKQDDVTIVGFDAGPAQVEQLKEGTVQALVAQEPEAIGADGVAQALAALDGDAVEAEIQTGFTIITQENVDGEAADDVYKSSC